MLYFGVSFGSCGSSQHSCWGITARLHLALKIHSLTISSVKMYFLNAAIKCKLTRSTYFAYKKPTSWWGQVKGSAVQLEKCCSRSARDSFEIATQLHEPQRPFNGIFKTPNILIVLWDVPDMWPNYGIHPWWFISVLLDPNKRRAGFLSISVI